MPTVHAHTPGSTPATDLESFILKFQIGPVQDFIAAARSTRDLWGGSYLLSWLVAAGIRELQKHGSKLIFPNPSGQPLLDLENAAKNPDHTALLTPNLPNLFVARIEGDPTVVAEQVKKAIEAEWKGIAKAVWEKRDQFGLSADTKDRFFAQVDHHLSIAWMTTPLTGGYRDAYQRNGWHLDAVRQTRDFAAWNSATGINEKDSLSGKEEALIGGESFRKAREKAAGEYNALFSKHADCLGAIAVIKRVWHLAYLKEKHGLRTSSKEFNIRSIPSIAARTTKLDDEEQSQEKTSGDKYIAAIAFDGDSIGAWVNGDKSPPDTSLEKHHSDFSAALSDFALKGVRAIIEPHGEWLGQLIYAGGDDVVALVPADAALKVAAELRVAFREATKNTPSSGERPDASAGIAIAHIHAPLQDLIREAQKAEKRAKNVVGRPAFSITLMKRSGEISHWGSQWEANGLELYQQIAQLLADGKLSARFPHRVCQLLEPYLTRRTDLSKQTDAIDEADKAMELICKEFAFAAERQGSKDTANALDEPLTAYLSGVLAAHKKNGKGKVPAETATQELLSSLIGLCTAVAFSHRNRPSDTSSPSAEKQPTLA